MKRISKTKRKTPTVGMLTEKQALLNIPTLSVSAFNIKEIESTQTKNAFVATIRPIIPISFAVMNAPRCQMRQPPQQ